MPCFWARSASEAAHGGGGEERGWVRDCGGWGEGGWRRESQYNTAQEHHSLCLSTTTASVAVGYDLQQTKENVHIAVHCQLAAESSRVLGQIELGW